MDILQATLAANIRVVKYVPSYGDQPNDVPHVTKCTHSPLLSSHLHGGRADVCVAHADFRDKFRGYHVRAIRSRFAGHLLTSVCAPQKRLSPKARPFYWHETSVIVRPLRPSSSARTFLPPSAAAVDSVRAIRSASRHVAVISSLSTALRARFGYQEHER